MGILRNERMTEMWVRKSPEVTTRVLEHGGGHRVPSTCILKSQEILAMTIKLDELEEHIQYMKDHALIAKFVGF